VTRELKLALIVGFLLVLVVTILISDHLSKARTSKLASDLDPRSSLVDASVPITPAELAGGRPSVPAPTGPIGDGRVAMGGQPPAGPIASPAVEQVPDAATVTRVADRPEAAPVELELGRPGSGSEVASTTGGRSTLGSALDDLRSQLENGLPVGAGLDGPGAGSGDSPAPTQPPTGILPTPVGPGPVIPVQPAQPERWHVVKEGDSAFDIAKKYYGDGNLWKKLQEANGDRIAKNGAVRIGVRIKLPPAEAISGSASASRERVIPTDPTRGTPSASSARPAPVEVLPKPVAASKVRTYTVVSGDTLIGIARKTLGSGKRADEIAALNKAKLRDRNTVVIGMTLQIPEK
jgi:nucleoid-associated protein YgaU